MTMRFHRIVRYFPRGTQRIMRVASVGVFVATPFLVVHGFSSPPQKSATTRETRIAPSRLFSSSSDNKNTFNPFNMVGDMASSLMGKSADRNNAAEKALSSLSPASLPDWESIRKQLESQMETNEERNFRRNLAKGYGVAGSPLHKVRLYDESNKEEDIRVTFYRDSASWCPYCQKVSVQFVY
jgi:glutathione S-transferase